MCHNSVNRLFCYCKDFISSAAPFKSILVKAFHICCWQSNSKEGTIQCISKLSRCHKQTQKKETFHSHTVLCQQFLLNRIHSWWYFWPRPKIKTVDDNDDNYIIMLMILTTMMTVRISKVWFINSNCSQLTGLVGLKLRPTLQNNSNISSPLTKYMLQNTD